MGVILAAGKGTRIQPFSDRYPKPILPIAGKPLIVYQLEALREAGVREIVIVIGHLGFEVVRALGDGAQFGVKIKYVEQGATLGIAHAVSRLEQKIDRPFFLFLGDIYFEMAKLDSMASALEPGTCDAVLAVKREPDLDAIKRNFVVHVGAGGFVERVIEKPKHPRTNMKGCGLYLFDISFFDAIRRTPRTAMRDEYEITDAIQIFIDDKYHVRALEIVKDDLNLTYAYDLLGLNLHVMRARGEKNIVGKNVKIATGAKVENSILMDNCEIAASVTLRDCLVFPGEIVKRAGNYDRIICVDGQELDCRHAVEATPDEEPA